MTPERSPRKIRINARADDKNLSLKQLKSKVPVGFVDQHYSSLAQLFAVDPLLLHDIIYICRPGDYMSLFQKIPSYLSLTWLFSSEASFDPSRHNDKEWLLWLETISIRITKEVTEE
jgi:hypothetical protein